MSLEASISLLTNAAEICEQNAKIQATEGDIDQASLNQSNAVQYRAAIVILNSAQAIHGNAE